MTRTALTAPRAFSTTRSSAPARLACRSCWAWTHRRIPTPRASRAPVRAGRFPFPPRSPAQSRTRCASATGTPWSTGCRSPPTASSSCLGTDPRATSPPVGPGGIDWRRNLAALWFAEFMAIFGFSFAFPFISIFIHHDLGVPKGPELDLWPAATASISGLSMAIASPILGGLGDAAVGLRLVFLGGGILLLLSTVPVLLIVQEGPIRPRQGARVGVLALIKQLPGTMRSLSVLIGAQGLISVCNSATQVLVVLRLLEMVATNAVAAITG